MKASRLVFKRLLISCLSIITFISGVISPTPAFAGHTPDPASVNLAGDLESEATAGACGDWEPGCPGSAFTAAGNNVYLFQSATIPAGTWAYKVAMGGWAENYGSNFQHDGPNINLSLASERTVRFYYDHKTHYIADNVRNTIYTVPGSFNMEINCSGDWQPECLRTLMSDVDGDGVFTFITEAIPAGNYAFKIATNESWSNPNYGEGGGPNDIPFSIPGSGFRVTFSFNTANNTPSVNVESTGTQPGNDNNVEWDGLRHDSRDPLYRLPGGAVEAGTPVTIRFRTFHNDVTGVKLRVYSLEANGQSLINMTPAASDVSCYEAGLEDETCDYWAATLPNAEPDNLWYRFIVTDGTDTDYYDDNTGALDGGLGAPTDDQEDNSFALMVYEPGFEAPAWAREAVIYQIFPDRFRSGRPNNDPKTGDIRYDDPVIKLPWGTLPEGFCRNYADGGTNCPWRFDDTPPPSSPSIEQPRGRDYFGGDLAGVTQQLDYLQSLGVTTIYFNPIFTSQSNHGYDTANFRQIDPGLGTHKEFKTLIAEAQKRGIRVILDGVFNHMSSDSPFFDRYHHYDDLGACESPDSPYRDWFNFRAPAGNEPSPCAPSTPGGNDTYYEGWFGFDSIPVIDKSNPEVQQYFLTQPNSISVAWLKDGAAGWRMDVSGDPSFPAGYWETFREVTKGTDPDALLISETWQKDSTLLRMVRGDRLDTTMNYRLRDAVLGLLAPGNFDSKGFADSGRIIEPTEFAARILSMREDYPDAAYYSLMNLLDSHDTERLLWVLTPATAETRAQKEFNADNLATGKRNLQLASLIQYTMPGAPTVYYGDEVGMTGDDDPDDRRTYPWADLGGTPDTGLLAHYQTLAAVRDQNTALTEGDIRILLADDATDVVAYGRKTASQAAVIIINRSSQDQQIAIPMAGYLPEGTTLHPAYSVGDAPAPVIVEGGVIEGTMDPKSAWILVTDTIDLQAPPEPTNLQVTNEGNAEVSLSWNPVSGAASYNVYRSPLTGGGFVKVNSGPLTETTFTDQDLRNAQTYFYVVTALDSDGNESGHSNEAIALPHLTIGWANLQWPPSMTHTVSIIDRTDVAYGQVWIDGITNQPGPTASLRAQLGFGPDGSHPDGNTAWVWVEAEFNPGSTGNNDEFMASMLPETAGTFDYAYRYSTTNGREWVYADLDGIENGYSPAQAGSLTVNSSADTTAPAAPTGLNVDSASPDGITLAWDAVVGDATLYGYEVRRSTTTGGPYTTVALVTETSYTDAAVDQGVTYYYVVRAVDTSFNRSADSEEVYATAELRTVTLVFNVTVPASTDGTGRLVHIAGTLSRLDGGLPDWNPGAVALTRVDATHWTITLYGKESTQIAYKFTLGDWEHVEKGASCDEISDRQLTLSYGAAGTQIINVSVLNWRNVAPCGN